MGKGPPEKLFPQIICDACMQRMTIAWIDTGTDHKSEDFLLAVCHDTEYLLEPNSFYSGGLYNNDPFQLSERASGVLVKSNLEDKASWLSGSELQHREAKAIRTVLQLLGKVRLFNRVRRSQRAGSPLEISDADFEAIVDGLMLYRPQIETK